MCGGGGTTTQISSTDIPDWLENQAQVNIGYAQDLYDRDYQNYSGDRIAGFTGDQNDAFQMIRDYGTEFADPAMYDEMAATAAQAPVMQYDQPLLLDAIAGNDGTYQIQDYMNPYVGEVFGNTVAEMNRQADVARNEIDSQATMAGAFGDARHGLMSSELDRNLLDQIGQMANQVNSDAYMQAVGMMGSDIDRLSNNFATNAGLYEGGLNRMMSGAGAASSIAGNDLGNYMTYVNALNSAGAQQQLLDQAGMDVGYQNFMNEWNYPVDMLNVLNQTTSLQPHSQSSTTTTTQPSASPFTQMLGAGMGLASLFV